MVPAQLAGAEYPPTAVAAVIGMLLDEKISICLTRSCRISNHWQWVIMLVILVVGIAGIWIGACIWRRRYLRKKDRQSSLGQKHSGSASRPSWGPGIEASEAGGMPYNTGYDSNRDSNGMMLPGAGAAVVEEKPKKEKKRWIVRDRT